MDFFKRTFSKQSSVNRTYSAPQSAKSIPDNLEDIGKDIIDYSPIVQQEKDGIFLQKQIRSMIREKCEQLNQWSNANKEWIAKYKNEFERKDLCYQSYSTTLELLKTTIESFEQINTQFDESKEELDKILRTIPTKEKRSIKSNCTQQQKMIGKAKQDKANVYEQYVQNKNAIKQNQKDREKKSLGERKRTKLEKQYESLKTTCKNLRIQQSNQDQLYHTAEQLYEKNMREIYNENNENELARLQKIPVLLKNFIAALNIDKSSLEQSIEKHKPENDLAQYNQKHFPQFCKTTDV